MFVRLLPIISAETSQIMFPKFGIRNYHKYLSDDSGLKHHLSIIKPSFATAMCFNKPFH